MSEHDISLQQSLFLVCLHLSFLQYRPLYVQTTRPSIQALSSNNFYTPGLPLNELQIGQNTPNT